MAHYKDVEIELDDVIGFIEDGITEKEAKKIIEAIKDENPTAAALTYSNTTIMDELAATELQEFLIRYGADTILKMIKAGKEICHV